MKALFGSKVKAIFKSQSNSRKMIGAIKKLDGSRNKTTVQVGNKKMLIWEISH